MNNSDSKALEQNIARARPILSIASVSPLTEREGQPDCWQMLNADNLKSILNP